MQEKGRLLWIAVLCLTLNVKSVSCGSELIIGTSSLSAVESDWEAVPPERKTKKISPVGISLTKLLNAEFYRLNISSAFTLTGRPDGLPKIGLLYVQDFSFKVTWKPPNEISNLPSGLEVEIGEDNMEKVKNDLARQLGSYYQTKIKNSEAPANLQIVNRYGLEVMVKLRVDLVCPVTTNRKQGGLQISSRVLIILSHLEMKLNLPRSRVKLATLPWTALTALAHIPTHRFSPRNNVESQMVATIKAWRNTAMSETPIDRASTWGPPLKKPSSLPMPDYEKNLLRFVPECAKTSILGTSLTFSHCAILPVEINRLYDEERALIHCHNLYPVGTQIFYIRVFQNPNTKALVRVVQWTSCKAKVGWTPVISLEEKVGEKRLSECTERSTFIW